MPDSGRSDDETRSLGDVTRLIQEWRAGDEEAREELFQVVYDDLRRVAASYMSNERASHTLPPTGLVNEVFLRLQREGMPVVPAENRWHFFSVAARAMRRILVEHARYHAAARRPSSREALPINDQISGDTDQRTLDEILDVDKALEHLRKTSERQARVVELRYFAGLEESEVADLLGVSRATVTRDWRMARLMLKHHLLSGASAPPGES